MKFGEQERRKYTSSDGTRLPGVTTVLGVLNKPLNNWAAEQERQMVGGIWRANWDAAKQAGAIPDGYPEMPERYAHETIRDAAADLGTIIHFRIECFQRGEEPEGLTDEQLEASLPGYLRFVEWWRKMDLRAGRVEVERVNEDDGFGGTIDSLPQPSSGYPILVDVKSTKRTKNYPYSETIAQVAAYEYLLGEPLSGVYVWRVGKEHDDPGDVYSISPDMRVAGLALFRGALASYKALAAVGRERRRGIKCLTV